MNKDSLLSLFQPRAGPIHATVKIISSFELITLTLASHLMLSRLRPHYAKVFKFHWLSAHFETVGVTANFALENS